MATFQNSTIARTTLFLSEQLLLCLTWYPCPWLFGMELQSQFVFIYLSGSLFFLPLLVWVLDGPRWPDRDAVLVPWNRLFRRGRTWWWYNHFSLFLLRDIKDSRVVWVKCENCKVVYVFFLTRLARTISYWSKGVVFVEDRRCCLSIVG